MTKPLTPATEAFGGVRPITEGHEKKGGIMPPSRITVRPPPPAPMRPATPPTTDQKPGTGGK